MRLDRTKVFLGNFSYTGVARLKPGATLEQATADAARLIPVALTRFPPFPGFNAKMFDEARLAPNLRLLEERHHRRRRLGAVGADGHHRHGAADRVRQRRQPAAGAGGGPPAGAGGPCGAWRQPRRASPPSCLLKASCSASCGGVVGIGLATARFARCSRSRPATCRVSIEISIDGPVLLFTAGRLAGLRGALRRDSGHQVRGAATSRRGCAAEAGRRARAGSGTAPAARWWWSRWRWRWCC